MRALLLAAALILAAWPAAAAEPALVLFITVDQLRGDLPWRFRERFGEGGFRYLLDNGTAYANAQYRHAATVTGPGHATLATGAGPAGHGLVGNDWYDRALGRAVNCVEDRDSPLTGRLPESVSGDPSTGRSPHLLTSSTFGDELVTAAAGRSRVFSASLKDRGAILPAGRLGHAWWYAEEIGEFVSSRHYFEELPGWVRTWNESKPTHRYLGSQWTLLQPADRYVARNRDDRLYERLRGTLGRTFPHPLGDTPGEDFYSALRYTPSGDELLLDFVKTLVKSERIGRSSGTDVLAVSFSASDYVGHVFGPYSLEAEDNLLRLDRTLARLLAFVDEEIGLDQTLVVLTSDHGVAPAPEFMAARGFPAHRHRPGAFMAEVNQALMRALDIDVDLAIAFEKPSIYLDRAALAGLGLEPARVERIAADALMALPGFRLALTRTDLMAGRVPDLPHARRLAAAFHAERSGDVLVASEPFWYLSGEPDGEAAMHGSPYRYDTHVPILLTGPRVPKQVVYREVAPRDIAPTISAYLGIAPPSASVGRPLVEALD